MSISRSGACYLLERSFTSSKTLVEKWNPWNSGKKKSIFIKSHPITISRKKLFTISAVVSLFNDFNFLNIHIARISFSWTFFYLSRDFINLKRFYFLIVKNFQLLIFLCVFVVKMLCFKSKNNNTNFNYNI